MTEKESDTSPRFDRRPWGSFTVLDEADNFKVKRIEVLSGKRLSYQKHSQRAEHWVVVRVRPRLPWTIVKSLHRWWAIDIAIGSAYRVENPGTDTLVFIIRGAVI